MNRKSLYRYNHVGDFVHAAENKKLYSQDPLSGGIRMTMDTKAILDALSVPTEDQLGILLA